MVPVPLERNPCRFIASNLKRPLIKKRLRLTRNKPLCQEHAAKSPKCFLSSRVQLPTSCRLLFAVTPCPSVRVHWPWEAIIACMSILLQDLRRALRALAAAPAFTVTAILSLAIGIGANTAIFSIVDGLLLRPLPYKDAGRLVILWNRSPGLNILEDWFSTAQYFDIKNGHRGFEQVAIAIGGNYNLTGSGEPERVGTIRVSSSLLSILGQRAALGRLFVPDEDLPGRTATAVLSYGTWARRFGSDPGILGKKIMLNGVTYEIVGVMPRLFSLPREVMPTLDGAEQAEILLPLPLPANAAQNRDHEDYNILGKLKPGVSRGVSAQRGTDVRYRAASRASGRQRSAHVVPAAGSGWLCLVDRVRELGEPATVACRRPAKGDCGAHRAGCNPGTDRSPVVDRKHVACVRRWRLGHRCGVSRIALGTAAWPAERAKNERCGHRSGRSCLHVYGLCLVGDSVWTGTSAAGFAARRTNRSAGHQSNLGRRQRNLGTRKQSSPLAGDRRDCALRDAVDWRRSAAAQLCSRTRRRSRLQSS